MDAADILANLDRVADHIQQLKRLVAARAPLSEQRSLLNAIKANLEIVLGDEPTCENL